MKTFLSLVGFYARSCFWGLLFQITIYVGLLYFFPNFLFRAHIDLFVVSLATRQALLPVMLAFSLGLILFMGLRGVQPDWRALSNGIPFSEFLLVRPVTRRQAYGAVAALFFLLVLVPVLGAWAVAGLDPALHIRTFGPGADAAAVAAAFPDSSVQGKEVVVPNGKSLIQGWQLWLVTLGATAAQFLFLLPLPMKVFRFVMVAPMALYFAGSFWHPLEPNTVFACFTRHWPVLAAGTLALFAAVQAFAWWRAARMEVY